MTMKKESTADKAVPPPITDIDRRQHPTVDEPTLLAAFDTHLRLTLGRSERTAQTYGVHVRTFCRYLEEHHRGVTLLDAKTMHVKAFLLHQAARGLAPASRANQGCALRALFAFLVEEDLVRHNPAEGVRLPSRGSERTEVYSEDEADTIIGWAADQDSIRWRVGHVVLATFRYTGLRLTELVTLRLDQVDLSTRRISVIGKGDKPRTVPIPPVLVPVLTDCLNVIRLALPASQFFFANPGSSPTGRYHGRYCPRSVQDLVQDAGEQAGVAGRHFPHRWRHSYATSLLRHGVDIHKVQRLLGHSNINTTIRYLHLNDADLADAVDLAFPAPGMGS
jgi:site-specific recombinase XerD